MSYTGNIINTTVIDYKGNIISIDDYIKSLVLFKGTRFTTIHKVDFYEYGKNINKAVKSSDSKEVIYKKILEYKEPLDIAKDLNVGVFLRDYVRKFSIKKEDAKRLEENNLLQVVGYRNISRYMNKELWIPMYDIEQYMYMSEQKIKEMIESCKKDSE